jgi:hypothetical protein
MDSQDIDVLVVSGHKFDDFLEFMSNKCRSLHINAKM